jgi:DNA-binding NarL/FixJ family response regulator
VTSQRNNQSMSSDASGMSLVRQLVGAEVLVIDHDQQVRDGLSELLGAAQLNVTAVDDPNQAWELLARSFYSVVVVDLDTPGPNGGLDTIAAVRVAAPSSAVVVLTPRKSYDDAIAAIRAGAVDVILKTPDSVDYLKERIHEAATRSMEKRQVGTVLRDVRETYDELLRRFMDAERRALDAEDKASGRDSRLQDAAEIHILVVTRQTKLVQEMAAKAAANYKIKGAQSGGEALDRCGSGYFHVVMIADDLDDLPPSMVTRSIKAQRGEIMVLTLSRSPNGAVVEMIEGEHKVRLAENIGSSDQLIDKLDDLTEAFRLRDRERRYLQAFRERHYDLLRRYAALKTRIDKVLGV